MKIDAHAYNPMQSPRSVSSGTSEEHGKVIVKIANPLQRDAVQAMDREVVLRNAMGASIHGIVPLLRSGSIKLGDFNAPYLIEPWTGEDLANHPDMQLASAAERLNIMHAVTSRLVEFHRSRVAHGDVKLNNITMGPDGKISLIDYGHSVHLPDSEHAHRPRGWFPSLAYPPENLVGFAADCYSLGVSLHCILHKCAFLAWRWEGECVKSDGLPTAGGCWPASEVRIDTAEKLITSLTSLRPDERPTALEALEALGGIAGGRT